MSRIEGNTIMKVNLITEMPTQGDPIDVKGLMDWIVFGSDARFFGSITRNDTSSF